MNGFTASMNREAYDLWLAALESGEYRQGKGQLRASVDGEERYCCLGVLCEVALKAGVRMDVSSPSAHGMVLYNDCSGTLPRAVIDWAGLTSDKYNEDPSLGGQRAGVWNDTDGKPFPEIVKLIRKYVRPVERDGDVT